MVSGKEKYYGNLYESGHADLQRRHRQLQHRHGRARAGPDRLENGSRRELPHRRPCDLCRPAAQHRCGGADRADRDRHARHDELSCHGRHGAAHAADVSGGDAPLFHERCAADGPGRHGTGKRHPHRRNQRSRRRRNHAGLYDPRQCLCRSLGSGHDREHRDRHRRRADGCRHGGGNAPGGGSGRASHRQGP